MLRNFSYLLPGILAGSAQPGRGIWGRASDPYADLDEFARNGIGAVVSLTEEGLNSVTVAERGFKYLHLPVIDYEPPTLAQIEAFVAFVDACVAEGVAVVVHCAAGMGRTGTMLAAYLISQGDKPGQALRRVRRARPGSVETPEQEKILKEYYRHLLERTSRG